MNEVGWSTGFESDDNALLVLDAEGAIVAEARGSKRDVAEVLWSAVREHRANKR